LKLVFWADVVEQVENHLRVDTEVEQSADHAAFVISEIDVEDVAAGRHLMDCCGEDQPGFAGFGFADDCVCLAGVEQS
jgi:hypothetical protein